MLELIDIDEYGRQQEHSEEDFLEAELLALMELENVEPLPKFIDRVTPRYPMPEHSQIIADLIRRTRHEPVRATLSMPPRHTKTETAINGLAWRLVYDPACTNAFCGYEANFSQSKSKKVQTRFLAAGGLIDKNSTAARDWATVHGGGLLATGIGGPLVGRGITGVGIIDDPFKNRKDADSPTMRRAVWDWFTSTFNSRIEPGASIIVIATRWHEDDLIGRLHSDKYEHEKYEEINLPAIFDENGQPADERVLDSDGEVVPGAQTKGVRCLWPSYWPFEELATKRKAGEYDWWSLYQGMPRPRGAQLFKSTPPRFNLKAFKENELSKGGFRLVGACDPAATASTRADYSAAGIGAAKGYGDEMELYWLYVVRGQWTIPVLCRRLLAIQTEWGVPWAIEAVSAFKSVPDTLAEVDPNLLLLPVELKGDKFSRSQPYAGAWQGDRIHVPFGPDVPWANDFIAEHAAFTGINDAEDDQVDMGAHGFTALNRAEKPRSRSLPPTGPYG